MTDFRPLRPVFAAASAGALLFVLSACGALDEHATDPGLDGGSSSVDEEQYRASAPAPSEDQLSHERLREALEPFESGRSVTDTDDWWPDLRDLHRELQKLRVDPASCKSFVTAGSLPVPSGALVAMAVSEDRETVVASFENEEAAAEFFATQEEGLSECSVHAVTRDFGDEELESEVELEELDLNTEAAQGVAMQREMDSGGQSTEFGVVVLLRHGSLAVTASEHAESEFSAEDAEDATTRLEEEAAAVLSDLTGEDLSPEEPVQEEDEDSDEQDSEDADDEAEPEDS